MRTPFHPSRLAGAALVGALVAAPAVPPTRAGEANRGGTPAGRAAILVDDPNDRMGYAAIFDGRTLEGWESAPGAWRVQDGALVAGDAAGAGAGSRFAAYSGAEPADFDLLLEVRSDGGHLGVVVRGFRNPLGLNEPGLLRDGQRAALVSIDQSHAAQMAELTAARRALDRAVLGGPASPLEILARTQAVSAAELVLADARATAISTYQGTANKLSPAQLASLQERVASGGSMAPPINLGAWNVAGYRVDFPGTQGIAERGQFSHERGVLSPPGRVTSVHAIAGARVLSVLPVEPAAGPVFRLGEWNRCRVAARGSTVMVFLNGRLLSMTVDENTSMRRDRGIIALHAEGDGEVRFREIRLREVR